MTKQVSKSFLLAAVMSLATDIFGATYYVALDGAGSGESWALRSDI